MRHSTLELKGQVSIILKNGHLRKPYGNYNYPGHSTTDSGASLEWSLERCSFFLLLGKPRNLIHRIKQHPIHHQQLQMDCRRVGSDPLSRSLWGTATGNITNQDALKPPVIPKVMFWAAVWPKQYDPNEESSSLSRVANNLGKCLPKCHHFEDKDMKGEKVLRNACVGSLIKKIRY